MTDNTTKQNTGLYDPRFEHDACGIGAIVSLRGIKTHKTVDDALKIVERLEHRAGKDATGETGDGVGIMLQISHSFFKKAAARIGIQLEGERDYGVGMFFFPQDIVARSQAKRMLEIIAVKDGLEFLGWRDVPVDPSILGKKALDCMPYIAQCFIKRPSNVEKGLPFDRLLYVIRREFEQSNDNTYVLSLSSPPQQAHPPQRRDQHHPRQHRPYGGPRGDHALGGPGPVYGPYPAGRQPQRLGLRHAGQHP